MAGNMIELGPKMDSARDKKIYDCYLFWKPFEFLDGCRMDILTDTDVGIYKK